MIQGIRSELWFAGFRYAGLKRKAKLPYDILQEHEELFQDGKDASCMYFLVDGKVVYKHKDYATSSQASESWQLGLAIDSGGSIMPSTSLMTMLEEPEDSGYVFVHVKALD